MNKKAVVKNIPKALRESKRRFMEDTPVEEILRSPEMANYLTNMAQVVSGVYDKTTRVQLIYDERQDMIAYMNKSTIVVNVNNILIRFFESLDKKIMCAMGLNTHEAAHKRYLNLPRLEQINEFRLKGKWPTSTPSGSDPYVIAEIEDAIMDATNNSAVAKIFTQIAWEINNIIADVHDENCVASEFPGMPAKSLAYPQVAMYELVPIFEDEIKRSMNKGERLSFILALILRYARFHDVKIDTEDCWENEFVLKLVECMDFIEDAIGEDDIDKRQESINEILVICWPFIKEAIEEMKEEEKKSGSGSGDGDGAGSVPEEILKKLLEALGESAGETKSTTPTGLPKRKPSKSSGSKKDGDSKEEEKGEGGGKEDDEGEEPKSAEEKLKEASKSAPKIDESESAKKAAEKLTEEVAERKAMEKEEKSRTSDICAEITAVDARGHAGIRVMAKRKSAVTDDMKDIYDSIAKDLLPISKTMQRQVKQVLKDDEGGKNYGQIYGKNLEGRSLSRLDGKYFSKTKLPSNSPRLAVAVLVDESGSMGGPREEAARKASILLEDFARGLNVPTLICGHSTEGSGTFALYSYVEFDKIDGGDKYRLADIHARSQNRDGLALKIMCERLSKRTEEVKMLIVISDGQPCDHGYGGSSAEREMQEICREYRKKGLTIFAAAIGNDKENIHRIYKEGFLDITDLTKLPKLMVGLIKKHIR